MRKLRHQLTEPVGFVPTMGYFHEGHLSLVRQARKENPSVVVSIFVNPTQFGPSENFRDYPRDLRRDLELLEGEKVDVVFVPSEGKMYPSGFSSWIDVERITQRLEGASRPGHFRGVTTICAKLFNIIQPSRAYFGQKDAQQAVVIKKMVSDLNMNLEIIVAPTMRENDGLAMSSRNIYLNAEERQAAIVLFKALSLVRELWQSGEKDTDKIRHQMTSLIQKEPLAKIDYVSIADAETLDELDKVKPPALVSLALKIGRTSLIDNVVVE